MSVYFLAAKVTKHGIRLPAPYFVLRGTHSQRHSHGLDMLKAEDTEKRGRCPA